MSEVKGSLVQGNYPQTFRQCENVLIPIKYSKYVRGNVLTPS